MFRALIPIVGILIAIGLFFTYVRPAYYDVQAVRAETDQYAEAIGRALELQRRVSELKTRQNEISLADLERLEALLPDRIDEVAFLVDLDALAARHGLGLSDILIVPADEIPEDRARRNEETEILTSQEGGIDTRAQGKYSTLDVHFAVLGTYDEFRTFLTDLEQSLVLVDVTKLSFGPFEEGVASFSMTVRLYSLNAPTT